MLIQPIAWIDQANIVAVSGYSKATRVATAADGTQWVNVTPEEFRLLIDARVNPRVWRTIRTYIEQGSSDMYGGIDIVNRDGYYLQALATRPPDEGYAVVVPLKTYNNYFNEDPLWGEVCP